MRASKRHKAFWKNITPSCVGEFNGLKFVLDGRGIYEKELDVMLKGTTSAPDTFGKSYDIESDYYNEIFDLIVQTETKTNKAVTLGFDLGGGATCNYVEGLFKKLGHKFHCVNDVPGISS